MEGSPYYDRDRMSKYQKYQSLIMWLKRSGLLTNKYFKMVFEDDE